MIQQRNVRAEYNLPAEVKFCKRCTISNQRPRITFDEKVCAVRVIFQIIRKQLIGD